MTAKRFRFNGRTNCIEYDNKSILLDSYGEDIEELLNELHEENHSLKFQLDECRNHKLFSRRELEKENEQLKHKNEVLTKKIDRLLNKRKGNEETNLEIMSYLHDNYYNIWEEVLKECYNE